MSDQILTGVIFLKFDSFEEQLHRLSMMIYQINESSYEECSLGPYSLNTEWYNQAVDIEAGIRK